MDETDMSTPHRAWYCESVLSGDAEVEIHREYDRVLAFRDPLAQAGIHVIVISKRHISSLLDP